MDQKRRSCKVAEFIHQVFKVAFSMCRVWINEDEAVKLRSLYIKVFKVALSMYREWISEDEGVKLRSLYIKCLKLRCLCIKCVDQ